MRVWLRQIGLAGIASALIATAPGAQAPDRSLLPLPRAGEPLPGGVVRVTLSTATELAPRLSLRPLPRGTARAARPAPATPATTPTPAGIGSAAAALALAAAVPDPATTRPAAIAGTKTASAEATARPSGRPEGLEARTRAAAARMTPGRVTRPGTPGTLCNQPGLDGERLEPIVGRISGCGIADPVRLRVVDGVPLSTPATINCATARALQTWLREGVIPAVGRTGGGVASLRVAASYACRTRNHRAGARLSEHATGNAIDISAIGLADGTEISVLDDWGRDRGGRILRQVHSAACGPFGTVLGPNSDRFHRDHFHFDVASYRSGAYCR
jgi:hypothetical protein